MKSENTVFNIVTQIDSFFENSKTKADPTQRSSKESPVLKLPKFELPNFYGDFHSW